MIIKNSKMYTEHRTFECGEICIQNDVFAAKTTDDIVMDAQGCYAIPGLIDLHFGSTVS